MPGRSRVCGQGGGWPGAVPPVAQQPRHRVPLAPAVTLTGGWYLCEGPWPERRLDPFPHHIQIDPDGSQRLAVQGAEQAGRLAEPDEADDLGLDCLRGDTMLAQDRAHWFAGGSGREQQMLAADIAVSEPAGMVVGLDHHSARLTGEALEHHRLPTRRPYLRCTVCLVTPSRLAMSCQDHPSARAFST